MVQTVKLSQTKDGKFFESRIQAKKHENSLKLREEIEKMGKEFKGKNVNSLLVENWDDIVKLAEKYNVKPDEDYSKESVSVEEKESQNKPKKKRGRPPKDKTLKLNFEDDKEAA